MLLSPPTIITPAKANNKHNGTIKMIAKGSLKLSNCAANTMNTRRMQSGYTYIAVFPAMIF